MKGTFVRQISQMAPLSRSFADNKVGGETIDF